MNCLHQYFENFNCFLFRRFGNFLSKCRFYYLQIHAAEIIPNQFVQIHEGIAEFECCKMRFIFCQYCRNSAVHQFNSLFFIGTHVGINRFKPMNQTESIPNFITEISTLFNLRFIEQNIISRWRTQQHSQTHRIGTKLRNQIQRIWTVAQAFAHFAALLISNNTSIVNVFEWQFFFVLIPCHDHSGNPEKHDFRGCYQIVCWVIVIQLSLIVFVKTIKYRDWPQPTTEPSIQNIFVLGDLVFVHGYSFFNELIKSGIYIVRHNKFTTWCIPSRDSMSPPQLTRNVPITDIFNPMAVSIL